MAQWEFRRARCGSEDEARTTLKMMESPPTAVGTGFTYRRPIFRAMANGMSVGWPARARRFQEKRRNWLSCGSNARLEWHGRGARRLAALGPGRPNPIQAACLGPKGHVFRGFLRQTGVRAVAARFPVEFAARVARQLHSSTHRLSLICVEGPRGRGRARKRQRIASYTEYRKRNMVALDGSGRGRNGCSRMKAVILAGGIGSR